MLDLWEPLHRDMDLKRIKTFCTIHIIKGNKMFGFFWNFKMEKSALKIRKVWGWAKDEILYKRTVPKRRKLHSKLIKIKHKVYKLTTVCWLDMSINYRLDLF